MPPNRQRDRQANTQRDKQCAFSVEEDSVELSMKLGIFRGGLVPIGALLRRTGQESQ